MTSIITRSGKGSALIHGEMDSNLDSLCGIVEAQTGTTYTVVGDDQNRTIEISNASAVTVTLTAIATILAAIDTTNFKLTIKNIGAGTVAINRSSTDTFDDLTNSKSLLQFEHITIQTDSSGALWNVLEFSDSNRLGGLTSGQFIRSDANDTATGDLTLSGDNTINATSLSLSGTSIDSTAAELNKLNGATATTTEFNLLTGAVLRHTVIEIGDWDMVSTGSVSIAHGLTLSKIRQVSCMIRNDADTEYDMLLANVPAAVSAIAGYIDTTTSSNVNLERIAGGLYDNTSHDSTSYNRGWITIQHID